MSFEFDGLQRSIASERFTRLRQLLVGASLALLTLPLTPPARAGVDDSAGGQILSISSASAPMPRMFAVTPERRALLNTIRFAEGTWANGDDIGYRVMFGGGLMDSLERHPDRVIRSSRYASAAAGAYQFMPFTWALASRVLGLPGFGPFAQDQAALLLIHRRGALDLADQGQFTPELAARLAPEWASFPTTRGSSFYGQPVKRLADLRRFYEWNLAQLRGATVPSPVPVASVPARTCAPDQLECLLDSASAPSRGN
jgi:muramidase (phage lysozyme)